VVLSGTASRVCAVATTLALGTGCSTARPVDPFAVRAALSTAFATIVSGSSAATDSAGSGGLHGDQIDARDELGLDASEGLRGDLDVRVSPDAEIRLTYERFHDFDGRARPDRAVRFDGATFPARSVVSGDLEWNRAALTWAERIAALRAAGRAVDVVGRIGVERDETFTQVGPRPVADRFQVATAPLAGIEARVGAADRLTFTVGADGGGISHGDKRVVLGDAFVGVAWNVAGPLDLTAGYEFSVHHLTTRRGNEETSDVRLNDSVFLVGLGLRF
jgi:hypothetical protein